MKELKKLIKAHYNATEVSFKFKNKYGIEILGDGTNFFTRSKEELYKLADLLKTDVKVDGDPSIIAFYRIEYDHKIWFTFIEQHPMTEEQKIEYLEKLSQTVKGMKSNE